MSLHLRGFEGAQKALEQRGARIFYLVECRDLSMAIFEDEHGQRCEVCCRAVDPVAKPANIIAFPRPHQRGEDHAHPASTGDRP